MNRIQMKSIKLSREFEKKVDTLIFEYIGKGVLEADILRSLEANKTIPLSMIISHNTRTDIKIQSKGSIHGGEKE